MPKLGDTPLVPPPASEPPMADDAPDRLIAFIYMMVRDLTPARYIDSLVSFIESDRKVHADKDLRAYADRIARRLMHDDRSG